MTHHISFARRFRYWLDNMTSRGTKAMIAMLFIMTMLLVVFMSLIVNLSGIDPEGRNVLELSWAGFMRAIDSGTMGGDQGPVSFLLAMLVITIGGIFVVGTLIGIITTGIDSKLDQLRKGKSFVAERDHTIILGWSPQIFTVISELVEANSNQNHACIAVLAERDKIEMEDEISSRIPPSKVTRIVCRTGCPIELTELEIVNHRDARSIIVMPPESGDPDSCVIKTILALVNNPGRRKEPYHIVGVLRDSDNLPVAEMVGGDEVQLIPASDLIARISAQTCRQSGLSLVYAELLDFSGDEIYFKLEPSLVDKSYGEMLHAYDTSAVIGIRRREGCILLNPPQDTLMSTGDMVVAISEDDDTIRLSRDFSPSVREDLILDAPPPPDSPERTIILGWNRQVPTIIRELDAYVAQGSYLRIVAEEGMRSQSGVYPEEYSNLTVETQSGCTTDRSILDSLHLEDYDHVIVESYSGFLNVPEADAKTLITILHLRNIREIAGSSFSIVSEMLDDRNRELAEITYADDFIVSDKLISQMLTQISENRELKGIFRELFDPEGSEIYLKPVHLFVKTGIPMDFYTVVDAALRRGETAIGYRQVPSSADGPAMVVVNPVKSNSITFSSDDRIIVLARD